MVIYHKMISMLNNWLYNQPDLFVAFQEYNPADPATPGPVTKWKVFGQWTEFETTTVVNTAAVPSVTTSYSWGTTSTAAAHTITTTQLIAKEFTVFYCYAPDGIIKKVLPQHITVLNYKTI